jgi:hypothetical protein
MTHVNAYTPTKIVFEVRLTSPITNRITLFDSYPTYKRAEHAAKFFTTQPYRIVKVTRELVYDSLVGPIGSRKPRAKRSSRKETS